MIDCPDLPHLATSLAISDEHGTVSGTYRSVFLSLFWFHSFFFSFLYLKYILHLSCFDFFTDQWPLTCSIYIDPFTYQLPSLFFTVLPTLCAELRHSSIMKNSIPSDVWEKKRALIAKLYKDEEWPLKQVIKQIRSDDFNPR